MEPLDEIRCRHLIIVDEQDRPRIEASVQEGVAEVTVAVAEDPSTHVLVYAGPLEPTGALGLGVELFVGGNSMGRMTAWEDAGQWQHNTPPA